MSYDKGGELIKKLNNGDPLEDGELLLLEKILSDAVNANMELGDYGRPLFAYCIQRLHKVQDYIQAREL